jgi:hypothetical protein
MGQPLIRIPQVRQKLEAMTVWLPVVDAFRTLVACPPPAARVKLSRMQEFACI